jgi:hypothetical protein
MPTVTRKVDTEICDLTIRPATLTHKLKNYY